MADLAIKLIQHCPHAVGCERETHAATMIAGQTVTVKEAVTRMFEFYYEMDEIFGTRVNVSPPFVSETGYSRRAHSGMPSTSFFGRRRRYGAPTGTVPKR